MAKINKTKDRAGAGEDTVKEDTYSLLGGGGVNWFNYYREISVEFPHKTET